MMFFDQRFAENTFDEIQARQAMAQWNRPSARAIQPVPRYGLAVLSGAIALGLAPRLGRGFDVRGALWK